MKVAISTAGTTVNDAVELRFGRATAFLICDTESGSVNRVDNIQQLNAAQGAGIQSAGNVVNSGATAVISGHCGPKAMRVLKSAGVKVYLTDHCSISDALERFKAGELAEISEADVEGHWV
jgi:predicted Fe-Mo cluster-binding NifX family protein